MEWFWFVFSTATLADQNQDIRIGCNAAVNPQNGYYSVGVTPLETTIIDFSLTNISATKTFTLLSWGCPIFTADMEFTQGPHPPLKPGEEDLKVNRILDSHF